MSRRTGKVKLRLMGRPQTAPRQSWSKWVELSDGTSVYKQPMPGRTYTRLDYPPKGRGRGESLTSARRMEAKLRAAEVIQLRCQGLTFATIARKLGFRCASGAYRAYKRTMDRIDWDNRRREELGIRQYTTPDDWRIEEALNRLERELAEMETNR